MPRFKITLNQEYKVWHRRQMEIDVEADDQDEAEQKAIDETWADPTRYETYTETTDVDRDYEPTVDDVEELEDDE